MRSAEFEFASKLARASIQRKKDMGTLSGMAAMATVGWALAEIDKETETGYERTSTYQGYKSHEEYNRSSKDGEVTVLVADRFVVEVRGNNLPMEAIMAALGRRSQQARGHEGKRCRTELSEPA